MWLDPSGAEAGVFPGELGQYHTCWCLATQGDRASATPVASFTKEINSRLAKHPLKTNGHLANLELTSLVKEATGDKASATMLWTMYDTRVFVFYKNKSIYLHHINVEKS